MKLSIDALKVDSYAMQVSENELTEIKGGTTLPCALYFVGAAVATGVTYVIVTALNNDSDHKECTNTTTTTTGNGTTTTTTSHTCKE